MTPVEAQARILSLEQELDHRDSEIRSLRTEVADLTTENAGRHSLLAETRDALEIQSGRIVELERRINQTSRNSSKPPSSDGPGVDRPRQRGGRAKRKRGGQPACVAQPAIEMVDGVAVDPPGSSVDLPIPSSAATINSSHKSPSPGDAFP